MALYSRHFLPSFSIQNIANAFMALALCGCGTLPGTRVDTVGTRTTEYSASVKSGPTIVFENGLGGTMEWWKKVIPEIEATASYFTYNRPGYGNSSAPSTPRDGEHIVEELHALLHEKKIEPPYVLVGHSLGGLYQQLFARKYPQDVAALILVDSTHPNQIEGDGAAAIQSTFTKTVIGILVRGTAKEEMDMIPLTGKQMLQLPEFMNKPVYVLSANQYLKEGSSAHVYANMLRSDLVRLHPGSKQIWIDSGHAIPLEKPEAIVDAIRKVLSEIASR